MNNSIILIHGYSDRGESFTTWKKKLKQKGYDATEISIGSYVSLSNEINIKDIAEGFDLALKTQAGLADDEPFDAIVHSTGMLVIRSWLVNPSYSNRVNRLKHLVGIAPATFGSPLAHKGRSWIGSIFKGNKEFGPDFMEAGDQVLDALELGSRFTWNLTHLDLLGQDTFYGPTKKTPYVFVFCGNQPYGGLRRFVNEPGTDGTVRWTGCALNVRKITVNLTQAPGNTSRFAIMPWTNEDIPLVFADGLNHGTILTDPTNALIDMVDQALQVNSGPAFDDWKLRAAVVSKANQKTLDQWQQFIVHAVDERGDPIQDFNLRLCTLDGKGKPKDLDDFGMDVHAYSTDSSFRCFHVNLTKLNHNKLGNLWLSVIASTGTGMVDYQGYGSSGSNQLTNGVSLNISKLLSSTDVTIFYPWTTTFIELMMNREPTPKKDDPTQNNMFWFLPQTAGVNP
jgi:hypothetical protein